MSRVGLKPITIPDGVSISQEGTALRVSGPKGELSSPLPPGISVVDEEHSFRFERAANDKQSRAYHGLARALAANAVRGVHEGFERRLRIEGIGYRARMEGGNLVLQVGYSHPVEFAVPEGIEIDVADQTTISVKGIDKQLVGETAARIRRVRPPDPYKAKGIRYEGEVIHKKVGKAGVGVSG